MAALSDPRGFMGAQQKQTDQMNQMGIEVTDSKGGDDKKEKKAEEKKEEPLVFEPITIESIRQEKGFQKTARKQQKELDALRKKQAKEKLGIQKSQCSAIEKLIKGKK